MGNCVKIRKTGEIVSREKAREIALEMVNNGRFTKDAKRTDSQLNNRLLELYTSILTSPANYGKLMKSIDDPRLKNLINGLKKLGSLEKDTLTGIKFISPQHQFKTKTQYQFSKMGVALQALKIVDNNLTKNTNIKLKSPMIEIESGGKIIKFQEWSVEKENLMFVPGAEGGPALDGVTKNQYEPQEIEVIYSALMNAYVDAASDPFIADANITLQTFPVAAMLIRAGVQVDLVMSFMMNPIIREWAKTKDMTNMLYSSESTNKMDGFNKNISKILGVKKSEFKKSDFNSVKITSELSSNSFNKYKYEGLLNMLKPDAMITESDVFNLINTYEHLANIAKDVAPLENKNGATTKGAGKSPIDIRAKQNNNDRIYNEQFPLENVNSKFEYKGVTSPVEMANQMTVDVIGSIGKNVSAAFEENIIAKVEQLTGPVSSSQKSVENGEKLMRGIFAYNYINKYDSLISDSIKTSPLRIFKTHRIGKGKYVSIADKLYEMQSKYPDNIFINSLMPIKSKSGYVFIKTKFTSNLTLDNKRNLQESFDAFAKAEFEETGATQFTDALVSMAVLTTGLSQSRNSYNELIPTKYWNLSSINNEYIKTSQFINSSEFINDQFINTAVIMNFGDFQKQKMFAFGRKPGTTNGGKIKMIKEAKDIIKNSNIFNGNPGAINEINELIKAKRIIVAPSYISNNVKMWNRGSERFDYYISAGEVMTLEDGKVNKYKIYVQSEKLGLSENGYFIREMSDLVNNRGGEAFSEIPQNFLVENQKDRENLIDRLGQIRTAIENAAFEQNEEFEQENPGIC